jgi:putative glycosyltransferase (TIGR04372 family)
MAGLERLGDVRLRLRQAVDAGLTRLLVAAITRFDWHLIEVSNPHRIGHLCYETDCFLKERILAGTLPGRVYMVETERGVANDAVAAYLSKRIRVTRSRRLLDAFKLAGLRVPRITRTHPYCVGSGRTLRGFEIYARWGDRPPLFRLTAADRRFGAAQLRAMGVPDGAWFVCVHARSSGYAATDAQWHAFRDMDVEDFGPALAAITARGGWCIRMGDSTMAPLAPRPNVIDYALSPFKSARMDVFLGAACRFFLGSASGASAIATLFGRPVAAVNLAPLSVGYGFGVEDLAIPQRVRLADGRLPPFEEAMAERAASMTVSEEVARRGVSYVRATPEEVREVAVEMLDRLDGTAVYTADDEDRQARFRALFRDGHLAYKAGGRIGRDFLRRYMSDAD